jgi:hypothetical protein
VYPTPGLTKIVSPEVAIFMHLDMLMHGASSDPDSVGFWVEESTHFSDLTLSVHNKLNSIARKSSLAVLAADIVAMATVIGLWCKVRNEQAHWSFSSELIGCCCVERTVVQAYNVPL